MSKKEYSNYQQKVVSNYYNNLDSIMLGKLQELVTEIYLAKDTSREDRLWQRAHTAMAKLKIPAKIVEHIMQKRDVKVLARNVEVWLKKGSKR